MLAKEYLERVAKSNAEEVGRATEVLKLVKAALQRKAAVGEPVFRAGDMSDSAAVPGSNQDQRDPSAGVTE